MTGTDAKRVARELAALGLCAGLLFAGPGALAGMLLLDGFDEPVSGSAHTSKGQSAWHDTTDTVMGGIRDGSVGCESSELDGTTTAQISGGLMEVTTNKKASPSVYLSYDRTAGWGPDLDSDPFNGSCVPALDLTDGGGNDRFRIVFASAALAPGRPVALSSSRARWPASPSTLLSAACASLSASSRHRVTTA